MAYRVPEAALAYLSLDDLDAVLNPIARVKDHLVPSLEAIGNFGDPVIHVTKLDDHFFSSAALHRERSPVVAPSKQG